MNIARVPALAALLLLSITAQAQLSIVPSGPTSDDEVLVRFSVIGELQSRTVTRSGNEIFVTWVHGGRITPPLELIYEVPLGELAPGQYRVTVQERGSLTFVVRNADAVPFRLRPWAVPADGSVPVHIVHDDPEGLCGSPNCTTFRLEIGGRTYRAEDLEPGPGPNILRLPSGPAGLLDARITNARGTFELPAALYRFDPFAPPDPSVFEPVLFPVLFGSAGANGSRWVSEAVIANPNPWAIQNYNTVERLVCVSWPCGERLAAQSRTKFEGEGHPRGQALLVPRGEADDLAFSLRIRDVSRDADNFGAQVPVVRERDMVRGPQLTLPDVPRDPRYRTKLRVYAFADPALGLSEVTEAFIGDGTKVWITLRPGCSGAPCAASPLYGELDLPPGAPGEHSDIRIQFDAGARAWAFASVTNNATQQVTIIAPGGRSPRQ